MKNIYEILKEYGMEVPADKKADFDKAWKENYRTKWYRCPYCGKKLLIYEDTAKCSGVYLNCRECKREINIKI